jgi:sporulation protein YlmC with PRC-barrel domain
MRLELGRTIRCSDGTVAELSDVVIDPTRRRVTNLVVQPHNRHRKARLVPAELAYAEEPSGEIALRCTEQELRALPLVEEFAYLRLGEFKVDDPDWDVGIEDVLAQPYYDYDPTGFVGGTMTSLDPHVTVMYDRIPKSEVEIRRASDVFSADDHRLGRVDGFLVDSEERITHVVLERGHLFGRREVTVPIGNVSKVSTDSVTLVLTKDEVGRLPAVPVRRW